MTHSNVTKRALLVSVLSLLLCFSMLLGTTYAWFTDTVASTGNIIQSGILDADLIDAYGNSLEGKPLTFQKAEGAPADEKVFWEPGCTYNLQDFKVVNKGNLAFKFKILITGIEGDYKLLEAIDWTVSYGDNAEALDLDAWHHLKPKETFPSEDGLGVRITGHMREDAGNEYQDLVAEGISIMIYAIQDTVEYDSFDNQYDAQAQLPEGKVSYYNPADAKPIFNLMSDIGFDNVKNAILRYMNSEGQEINTDAILGYDPTDGSSQELDAAYKFSTTDTESTYEDWFADFVIYADKDVPASSVAIAGQYDSGSLGWGKFPWIALTNEGTDIPANEKIRLLGGTGFAVTYEHVMAFKDFYCGIANIADDPSVLDGITVTVELCLFKEATADADVEHFKVQTTTYTFGKSAVVNDAEDLALALSDNREITLVDDVVVSNKLSVPAGKEVVLDLNGHTIAGAFNNAGVSAVIENKGTLTIKNGKIVSLAEFPDVDWAPEGFPTYATNTIANSGNLVIDDGAYIENQTNVGGASYAIDNYAGGTLTVNSGIIRAKDHAIRLFTSSSAAENNVTINGGTIIGKRAIWVQLAGSDNTVAPKVNLTINGGQLESNVVDGTGLVMYSYSYGNSFANTNVTIAGGQFLNGSVQFGGGYKADTENVSITGGTFEQDVIRWVTSEDSTVIYAKNN